jgi:hypothetical protein
MLTVDDITNTDRAEALFASEPPTGILAGRMRWALRVLDEGQEAA